MRIFANLRFFVCKTKSGNTKKDEAQTSSLVAPLGLEPRTP